MTLGWCPVELVLLHGEKVGHPSSDGVTIKIPYGVDILLLASTIDQPLTEYFPNRFVKIESESLDELRLT